MGIRKATLTVGTGDAVSGTFKDQTTMESVVTYVTLPVSIGAAENEYIRVRDAAYGALGFGLFTGLMGEAWGHARERAGSKSFIPVFRGAAA